MKLKPEHIEQIKEQYDLLQNPILQNRQHPFATYRSRPNFQRDYSRILYSNSFRRLQGKMQILGIHPSAFFRNRLTHSLEVAQVASGIAAKLREACGEPSMYAEDEAYLIQAAGLAHDIGHPAFGHSGERVLDQIGLKLADPIRFEGNAQNFRVLRLIEKKDAECQGLNLTNRSLLAINKYLSCENTFMKYRHSANNSYEAIPMLKKYLYEDDYNYLEGIREETGLKDVRTLDVQIIDVADEIAYAIHDLEDGLALHSFSIDDLIFEMENYDNGKLNRDIGFEKFKQLVNEVKKTASKSSTYKTLQEYSQVFRKELASLLTNEFLKDLTLVKVDAKFATKHGIKKDNWELRLSDYYNLREALSDTLFTCISRDPIIEIYERRGSVVVNSLYETYNNDPRLLPPDYRHKYIPSQSQERLTMDYISGMMDTFAIQEFEKYQNTKFDKIVL